MRHFLLAMTSAAALLTFGSLAPGQAPSDAPRAVEQSTVKLSMEQEHIIKELMKDQKVEPQQAAVPETVGAAVPSSVTLRPIPEPIAQKVPQIKSHRFFVKDNRIYLVDPKDNSIADVIE